MIGRFDSSLQLADVLAIEEAVAFVSGSVSSNVRRPAHTRHGMSAILQLLALGFCQASA